MAVYYFTEKSTTPTARETKIIRGRGYVRGSFTAGDVIRVCPFPDNVTVLSASVRVISPGQAGETIELPNWGGSGLPVDAEGIVGGNWNPIYFENAGDIAINAETALTNIWFEVDILVVKNADGF